MKFIKIKAHKYIHNKHEHIHSTEEQSGHDISLARPDIVTIFPSKIIRY